MLPVGRDHVHDPHATRAVRPIGEGATLILDAGAGLQRVSSLLDGAPFDGMILLTHLHWDHVLGLPFFAAADNVDARVSVLLPEQESGASAERVLAGMMSPP